MYKRITEVSKINQKTPAAQAPPRSMTAGVGWGGRDVCQSSTTIKKSDEKKGE